MMRFFHGELVAISDDGSKKYRMFFDEECGGDTLEIYEKNTCSEWNILAVLSQDEAKSLANGISRMVQWREENGSLVRQVMSSKPSTIEPARGFRYGSAENRP